MKIIINGILKEFPQIQEKKTKVKIKKLDLSKISSQSYCFK